MKRAVSTALVPVASAEVVPATASAPWPLAAVAVFCVHIHGLLCVQTREKEDQDWPQLLLLLSENLGAAWEHAATSGHPLRAKNVKAVPQRLVAGGLWHKPK